MVSKNQSKMPPVKERCLRLDMEWSDFGLQLKDPTVWARSQWPGPRWAFIAYRIVFMLYVLVWELINIISGVMVIGAYHFIFATNWSFCVLALYGITAATTAVYFYCCTKGESQLANSEASRNADTKEDRDDPSMADTAIDTLKTHSNKSTENGYADHHTGEGRTSFKFIIDDDERTPFIQSSGEDLNTPWFMKLSWLLFNINIVIAPFISIIYWICGQIVQWDYVQVGNSSHIAVNIHVHSINTVLIILDLFVSAFPVRIVHCVYGMSYGLVYVVFTLIYWAAGGKNDYNVRSNGNAIYPGLNWEDDPGAAVGITIAFFAVILVLQCVMYSIYKLRMFITQRLKRQDSN